MARWPPGFTMLPIPSGPLSPAGAVNAVSADGKTAVGYATADTTTSALYHQACYWTPTSGPVFIAPVGTTAWDVSQDGSVIVGGPDVTGGTPTIVTPFYWTASGGVVPFGASTDSVNAISADGSRVVGNGASGACYWNVSTLAQTFLPLPTGFSGSSAIDVSADGSVIVGQMTPTGGGPTHLYRWTSATGMVDLGLPVGVMPGTGARMAGCSDDGNTLVGGISDTGEGSFIWTPTSFVEIPNTAIYGFVAVSGDGSTVYGSGWYPDVTHDHGDHIAYMVNGHAVTPTPTLFPPSTNEPSTHYLSANNGISRDGLVMGGYCEDTIVTGVPSVLRPFIYVAPGLAMDNVMIGTGDCVLCLDWSDDRGHTFGVPVCQPMSSSGFLTSLQWQRLGYARDRLFRLTWTCAEPTALQGAWYTAIAERRRGKK